MLQHKGSEAYFGIHPKFQDKSLTDKQLAEIDKIESEKKELLMLSLNEFIVAYLDNEEVIQPHYQLVGLFWNKLAFQN